MSTFLDLTQNDGANRILVEMTGTIVRVDTKGAAIEWPAGIERGDAFEWLHVDQSIEEIARALNAEKVEKT